jgi:uncharacterized protein
MDEALTDTLIQQVFDVVDPDGMVSFAFQGGEPTLAGLPFFQHFVAKAKQCRPPKVSVGFAIQTNGTLLDDAWAHFFKQENFLVGLSLDGFRSAHEAHRVDTNGVGTWKKVLGAKNLLEQYRVEYNALCVVTGLCAGQPEQAYRSLKNLNIRYMQFIACLDPIGHKRGQEPWSLPPEAYGKFLCKVFDLWYQDWLTGDYHSVRLFDDYIHILLGDGAGACATCGKCSSYLVVEGDGSVYPCDFFALDDWQIGNLRNEPLAKMAKSETAQRFLRMGKTKPTECAACRYKPVCNGGCPNDWYIDETGTHNYYCSSFQRLFDYAMPRMQRIAQAERAAKRRYCFNPALGMARFVAP